MSREIEELTELVTTMAAKQSEILAYIEEDEKRWAHLMIAQETNTAAITALTEATRGIIEAWKAAILFQKFIRWLSGFTIIAVVIAWFVTHYGPKP